MTSRLLAGLLAALWLVAALRLWWQSYAHETPAASLPNNDTLLADYAGYGVAVKAWRKVKDQAMRGWELCSDGRWYHRTVAEVAMKAWGERLRSRERQRKWRERNDMKNGDVTVTKMVTEPLRNGDVTADRIGQDSDKTGKELVLTPANAGGGTKVPPCPHEDIIELYHKHLPMGRQVKLELWEGQRKARLQTRWREKKERQHLGWWDDLFTHVAASAFLTGRAYRPGHEPFLVNLDWILKPDNMAKIIEGEYNREKAA